MTESLKSELNISNNMRHYRITNLSHDIATRVRTLTLTAKIDTQLASLHRIRPKILHFFYISSTFISTPFNLIDTYSNRVWPKHLKVYFLVVPNRSIGDIVGK